MRTREIKKIKVQVDSSLDQFEDLPLFEEKVAKANEIMKRVGLPKAYSEKK